MLGRTRFLSTRLARVFNQAHFNSGDWGSGAGKGGGSGGSIRDAGGAFGKMVVAREEEYFRKLQREQLLKLKGEVNDEILSCQKLIYQHRESIARLEDRVAQLSEEQSHPQ